MSPVSSASGGQGFPVFMPLIALVLILLPVRLQPRHHIRLAFAIWLIGGILLTAFGLIRLQQEPYLVANPLLWGGIIAVALLIGFAKGKFILSKTSNRNIERIQAMTEAHKPIHVYSIRSWIVIALMVLISASLTIFNAPLAWRGGVNLAVGMGLMISSLNYLKAFNMGNLPSSSSTI